MIEVFIDLVSHPHCAAAIQVCRNANSREIVEWDQLIGMKLDNVFSDSMGRLVFVYKS